MESVLSVSPAELVEHVMGPVCGKIVSYLGDIFQGPIGGDIEALVLTGGFCALAYLKELMKDICITVGKMSVTFPPDDGENEIGACFGREIIRGAMLKAIDELPSPEETTLIWLEDKSSMSEPADVYVFIGNISVIKHRMLCKSSSKLSITH